MKKFINFLSIFAYMFFVGCASTSTIQVNIKEGNYLETIASNTVDYFNLNQSKYPPFSTSLDINKEDKFGEILAAKIETMNGYKVEYTPTSIPVGYKINYLGNNQIIFILDLKDEAVSKIFQINNDNLIPISSWSVLNKSNK